MREGNYNILKVATCILILFVFFEIKLFPQDKYSVSGYIKDAANGEGLIGATIYVEELKSGTATNQYGFYSITLPQGSYTLIYNYIGYSAYQAKYDVAKNQTVNIDLEPQSTELDEVVIRHDRNDKNIKSTEMGRVNLDMKKISSIPILMGEQDILKTLQLSAGVKSAGEGSSGFYVRGGTTDQNLILIDEAPVYNASHLLGFFSVFNSDALKSAELIKGSIPANYGGRISSVLDIKMNDGNTKKYSVSGGIGLISSRLTVEGPIKKESSSFIISGRRTYADLFTKTFGNSEMKKFGLYFYDFNAKGNYIINQNNRIFISGYFGRDVLDVKNALGFDWGNTTATLRWNHLFSDKLFLNTSFIYSDYDYLVGMEVGSNRLDITSGIVDYNLKEDFQYFINLNNSLKFGLNNIYHTFFPGELTNDEENTANEIIMEERYALESGAYVLNDMKISDKLKVNYGLRFTMFNLLGPGKFYDYNDEGELTDSLEYNNGDIIKTYIGLEPRLSMNYMVNSSSSLKASYTRNYQYLHLLTKSTSSSPTDLWVPCSNIIQPQYADQYSIGYFKNFNDNEINFSTEVYYKNMYNQIDYKNGADLSLNEMVESQLVFGKGRGYGVEFLVEKKKGEFTGWLSYTLSRTERKFDAIDNGSWYPAKQDRIHDISIVGMYRLNNRLTLSGTWVYYTGDAVTFPSGKYSVDGFTVNYFSKRNGERMPDYHRLDLGLSVAGKKTKRYESNWNFSLYNVYARKNAYSISFKENPDNPTMTEAVRLSLFSIVPSVTYNFKF